MMLRIIFQKKGKEYVQKIFFAGTNDEWKALEGVEYIRISNELITSDVK